jgi:polar amino acid transport system substrate-binding protein
MLICLAILALSIVLGSAQASAVGELAKIKNNGVIRIAVFSDKPPFGYLDSQGGHKGFDIFFAQRLAKDLLGDPGKIEYIDVEAGERIEILESDRADIVLANFTVTQERAQKVDFAKPYLKVMLGVVSPKFAPITDLKQLSGKKLIINKGTTAEIFFTKNYPDIKLLSFDNNSLAFDALRSGKGAALAHDNTLCFAFVREFTNFVTGIDSLGESDAIAPAVKKGNTELLEWLNEEITKLQSELFFFAAYEDTLLPIYGESVDPLKLLITD